ncbi:hypothetical protein [Hyphomonas sp.]|uniref:hypothetical protein n=1 Tax=Hyphomonas sp. TaxID=87 RepID=UPI0025C3D648|nr:hypothetical protein [Hyphomonas sp.]MBI1400387.1 hypothetical protein [Hyphomonas sp.]
MSRWLRIGFGLVLVVLAIGLYLAPQFTYTNETQGESLVFVPLGLLVGIAVIGVIIAATGVFDIDGAEDRLKAEFDAIPYANRPQDGDGTAGPKETQE